MINLHIVNYSEGLGNQLLKKLQEKAQSFTSTQVAIEPFSIRPYWKYKEETECLFVVKANKAIDLEEFLACFDCDEINITEAPAYNCLEARETIETFPFQHALWSKNVSNEFFLDPHVVWANIYTWNSNWASYDDELEIDEAALAEIKQLVDELVDECNEEECEDKDCCASDDKITCARYDDSWDTEENQQNDEREEEHEDNEPLPIMPCENGKIAFVDFARNGWMHGPTQLQGEFFEWDILMSDEGKEQWQQFSPDGIHVSVDFDGQPTT